MPGGVNLSSSGLSPLSAHRAFREKGELQGPGSVAAQLTCL